MMLVCSSLFIMATIGNASLLTELKENYIRNDDNQVTFFGSSTINVQSFTIGSVGENSPFNLSSFKLKLYRIGSPGTTGYIYFYDMSAPAGVPYITPINIITFNPNSLSTSATWYEFNISLSDYFICNKDDIYAIGVKITSGGLGNSISWRCDATSPTYSGGNRVYSTDTGATWIHDTTRDFMFAVYGKDLYNNTITVYNNTQHTTGKYATNYNRENGFTAWLNFTGEIPTTGLHENIKNATGTLQTRFSVSKWAYSIWANYTGYSILLNLLEHLHNCTGTHASYYNNITGWKVYNNYTGYSLILTILENLKNCSGTEQYYYNNITGWRVYNNFTGFSILLNAIENLINCTGTHASYYNSATGWKMYLNYTGNVSGGGSPVNRTINITLNGHGFFNSWNGSINTNVQNISILMNSDKSIVGNFSDNDSFYDDKYFLSGVLSIESGLLFLGICLSLWIFFISKYLEYRDMTIAYIQFGLSIPTCIIVGTFSFSYAFGFVIVFLIPILSLSLIADSYFYRKKLKDK